MAGLLYAGFDYGATSNLPGPSWDSAVAVSIVPGAGRIQPGGGAALFNAASGSRLVRDLTWTGTATQQARAVMGLAVLPLTPFGSDTILAQFRTTDSVFALHSNSIGEVWVTQNGTEICRSVAGLLLTTRGNYLEWQVELLDVLDTHGVILRVNTTVVGHGAIVSLAMAETFVGVTMGNSVLAVGTWYLDDVYVLDGRALNPLDSKFGYTIDNASFLGNIVVQALFPTADGYNINNDPGYTPWTPSSGASHFAMVNENPPNGGVTNESTTEVGTYNAGTHHLDKYDTFVFRHPLQGINSFGIVPGTVNTPFPMYAIQVIMAMSSDAPYTARATARAVDTLPSTDDVRLGAPLLTVDDAAYLYFAQIFDRDPSL
jgi:hypothetical protein